MAWGHGGGPGEPQQPRVVSDRTRAREAFFIEFATVIRTAFPDTPLIVTGGFSTRGGMESALASGGCDLVGLGRPAVLNPSLPANVIFNPEVKDQDAVLRRKKIEQSWIAKVLGMQILGAGIDTVINHTSTNECSSSFIMPNADLADDATFATTGLACQGDPETREGLFEYVEAIGLKGGCRCWNVVKAGRSLICSSLFFSLLKMDLGHLPRSNPTTVP